MKLKELLDLMNELRKRQSALSYWERRKPQWDEHGDRNIADYNTRFDEWREHFNRLLKEVEDFENMELPLEK